MIHDVDESLRTLLQRDVRGAGEVEVAFDAPSTDWASRRSGPAINIYLYDIREDLTRRNIMYERIPSEDDPRITSARRPPSRFFKLSYLLTAWTQRPEDEHRLLSSCLGCMLRYEVIPTDALAGALIGIGPRCQLQVAQPPPGDRSISDIWTALGGELKPSLDVRVTAPFVVERGGYVAPPVTQDPSLLISTATGVRERPLRRRRESVGRVDADGEWSELIDETLHGDGAARTSVVTADPDAATEAAAAAELVGPEAGRWFRVRERPRPPQDRRPIQ